jgi:hypothetical protein
MRSEGFLGAFARSRKATISLVMSLHLFARIEQSGCHGTNFYEI